MVVCLQNLSHQSSLDVYLGLKLPLSRPHEILVQKLGQKFPTKNLRRSGSLWVISLRLLFFKFSFFNIIFPKKNINKLIYFINKIIFKKLNFNITR